MLFRSLEDYYGLEIENVEEWGETYALYDAETPASQSGASMEMEETERRFALYLELGEELGERRFFLDLMDGVARFNM